MRALRQVVTGVMFAGATGVVGACDGEPHPDDTGCATGVEPVVEVGTGLDAFESLAENDELFFFLGPQGGYHVFGSARARGLAPGPEDNPFDPLNPSISFDLIHQGAPIDSYVPQPRHLDPAADGWEQILGQVVVIGLPDPLALEGQTVGLGATLTDRCGSTATDVRDVVLRLSSTL